MESNYYKTTPMKNILSALFIVLWTVSTQAQTPNESKATSFYFIRHAEKNISNPADKDPDLVMAGVLRAARWSSVFNSIDFDIISTTNYKRTRNTALPIAEKKKLPLTYYSPNDFDSVRYMKQNLGKTVLIVGHSNTIPAMVNALIGKKQYKQIKETNYANLYIINITESGEIIHQLLAIE